MGSYEADARLPDLDREPGFIKTQEEPGRKVPGFITAMLPTSG